MIKTSYEVIKVEDNHLFDQKVISENIEPALLVTYLHPNIALPFIHNYLNQDIKGVSEKINFNLDENVSKNSNVLLSLIVNDLCHTAKKTLEKENDNGIPVANLIKNLIEKKVLKKINKNEETKTFMSVEDLMSKLYVEEEKGSKIK